MPRPKLPESKKRIRMNIMLSPEASTILKELSKRTNTPMSHIIEKLILNKDSLNNHKVLPKETYNSMDKLDDVLARIDKQLEDTPKPR